MSRRRFPVAGRQRSRDSVAATDPQARSDSGSRGAADPLQRPDVVGSTRRVVDSAQNDPVVVGIERRLRCVCGCGLDVFTCRTTDFTCTYSPALHDEVVAALAESRSADSVVAQFVAKYGESVLMAPRPRGFGLVGYLLPGAAILGAMGLLGGLLLRRSRRMAEVAAAEPAARSAQAAEPGLRQASGKAASPDELARLERALRDLES